MTNLAEAIDALRSAVCGPDSGESQAVHATVDPSVFADADVVSVPDEGTLAHVSVSLREPATIEDLEAILGPAHRLPRNPSGGARTVLFDDTLPAEGESGATVLAEVDDDDRVVRLIVRADTF